MSLSRRNRLAIGASPRRKLKLGPVARGVAASVVAGLLVARLFFVQLVVVRGNTMAPNVLDGDVLLVHAMDTPRRGDVVLLNVGGPSVVRRVVGLPGETIGARSGVLARDELPVATRLDGVFAWRSITEDGDERPHRQRKLVEATEDGLGHAILGDYEGSAHAWSLDLPDITVPPGHLYVLCDNRRLCPLDERAGLVPVDAVEGVARSLLWYGDARAQEPAERPLYGAFAPLASGPIPALVAPGRK
ncbi:MAG: signal peptidase I [Myxococcales bacterium]|nr:signal peptidase I [Myxococcales bacterium]